eukprot:214562-Chlamydomonas_euryale.AAC.6
MNNGSDGPAVISTAPRNACSCSRTSLPTPLLAPPPSLSPLARPADPLATDRASPRSRQAAALCGPADSVTTASGTSRGCEAFLSPQLLALLAAASALQRRNCTAAGPVELPTATSPCTTCKRSGRGSSSFAVATGGATASPAAGWRGRSNTINALG